MKVTVLSNRDVSRHPSRCYGFEFEDLVVETLQARLVTFTKEPRDPSFLPGFLNPFIKRAGLSRRVVPKFFCPAVAPNQDVLFANLMVPPDAETLHFVPSWRDHARLAVCWISELFVAGPPISAKHLALIDKFDLVILNFEGSVDHLQRQLSHAEVIHMPLGIDTARFCPIPRWPSPDGSFLLPPDRSIDLYWMGRNNPRIHTALREWALRTDRYYLFNSVYGNDVSDPTDHRELLARRIRRTRLFAVQPAKFNEPELSTHQHEIGFRYFEGAAAGAALIGRKVSCDSFEQLFPWQDAVIELSEDPESAVEQVEQLLAAPARAGVSRMDGVRHCLNHHDWLHRMEAIFDRLDLGSARRLPGMEGRRNRLAALDAEIAARM